MSCVWQPGMALRCGFFLLSSLALRAQSPASGGRHREDFLKIRLNLEFDAPAGRVSGEATYCFRALEVQDSIFLHAEDTQLSQARLDGLAVSCRRVSGGYWFRSWKTLSGKGVDSLKRGCTFWVGTRRR